jgi:hypothetical protein
VGDGLIDESARVLVKTDGAARGDLFHQRVIGVGRQVDERHQDEAVVRLLGAFVAAESEELVEDEEAEDGSRARRVTMLS